MGANLQIVFLVPFFAHNNDNKLVDFGKLLYNIQPLRCLVKMIYVVTVRVTRLLFLLLKLLLIPI